jgi:hypothetical protein
MIALPPPTKKNGRVSPRGLLVKQSKRINVGGGD